MPRETIRISNDETDIFDVKIGWEKDRHMQIGLEHFEHRSLFWTLLESRVEWIGSEIRRIVAEANEPGTLPLGDLQIGKNILNMLDCATHGPISSLWTSPSRHEVNELIRLLRKARDSAFGRDE